MEFNVARLLLAFLLITGTVSHAQTEPAVKGATPAILEAFQSHDIVMLGEIHGNKQEYEWLRSLVASPEFANRVDDIVMEFGNSLYQHAVDRFVSGEILWRLSVRPHLSTNLFIELCVRATSHATASTRFAFFAAIPISIGGK